MLRETDEEDPFWTNALLLDMFNDNMDKRTMDLALSTEGWVTDEVTTDVEADQREYSLPEGTGRVKRVSIVKTTGTRTVETPLVRDERWSEQLVTDSTVNFTDSIPTYRLVGELIILEQPVGEDITDGLRIDIESSQARLTGDASKLTVKFPAVLETLLKYDTVVSALRHEAAQNATLGGAQAELDTGEYESERNELAIRWQLWVENRTEGRVFSEPMYFGD
jgi:hypothetical protein